MFPALTTVLNSSQDSSNGLKYNYKKWGDFSLIWKLAYVADFCVQFGL